MGEGLFPFFDGRGILEIFKTLGCHGNRVPRTSCKTRVEDFARGGFERAAMPGPKRGWKSSWSDDSFCFCVLYGFSCYCRPTACRIVRKSNAVTILQDGSTSNSHARGTRKRVSEIGMARYRITRDSIVPYRSVSLGAVLQAQIQIGKTRNHYDASNRNRSFLSASEYGALGPSPTCRIDTFFPTTAVSPITTPVPWSMSSPQPRRAAGWMSIA